MSNSTSWPTFSNASFKNQEGYEKSLVGGKYFSHGSHDVAIEAVEGVTSAKGTFYLRVTLGAEGKSIRHNLFLTATDKKTNDTRLNRGYSSIFAGAIIPNDDNLKFEAFNDYFPNNPSKLESLVGAKLNITIGRQKDGYTVEKTENGFLIMDVATKLPVVLEDSVENNFEDFTDAIEVAKSQGLKRAWDEVTHMRGIEGNEDVNVALVKGIISGKTTKKVANM